MSEVLGFRLWAFKLKKGLEIPPHSHIFAAKLDTACSEDGSNLYW